MSKWEARAELAERSVHGRHLRRLWGMPGTLLGVSGWPATPAERTFGPWNYWWQAHVLDCLVDAYVRSPDARRRAAIARFANGVRVRNGAGWLNDYYDDMAWLALALQRAERRAGVRRPPAVEALAAAIRGGWTTDSGGGIWWRRQDTYDEDFKNVPANGPAAILFARLRDHRAYETMHWIESRLVDPDTGLVWDGLHVKPGTEAWEVEQTVYTYCQGVYLGACIELALWGHDGDPALWTDRAARTVRAVATRLTDRPEPSPASSSERLPLVLRGGGGRDGGLFAGILARYLAQAALVLPEFGARHAVAARLAADIVFDSAAAAWENRAYAPGGPLFGPEWSQPAESPRTAKSPERDLSVQAGAWTLLEAAALLDRSR